MGKALTKAEHWASLRATISWLKDNGPEEDNGVDAKTAGAAQSFIDLAEAVEMTPPLIFWHGGDAIVFTWGRENAVPSWMVTLCGDTFHVHYPDRRAALGAQP